MKKTLLTDEEKKESRILAQKKYRESENGKQVMQEWYTKNKDLEHYKKQKFENIKKSWEKNPKARKARSLLEKAVKTKKIEKLPCLICGEKSEAHHSHYDLPLDVTWLCRKHHIETHKITRELT